MEMGLLCHSFDTRLGPQLIIALIWVKLCLGGAETTLGQSWGVEY